MPSNSMQRRPPRAPTVCSGFSSHRCTGTFGLIRFRIIRFRNPSKSQVTAWMETSAKLRLLALRLPWLRPSRLRARGAGHSCSAGSGTTPQVLRPTPEDEAGTDPSTSLWGFVLCTIHMDLPGIPETVILFGLWANAYLDLDTCLLDEALTVPTLWIHTKVGFESCSLTSPCREELSTWDLANKNHALRRAALILHNTIPALNPTCILHMALLFFRSDGSSHGFRIQTYKMRVLNGQRIVSRDVYAQARLDGVEWSGVRRAWAFGDIRGP